MLHAADLHTGWRAALSSLAQRLSAEQHDQGPEDEPTPDDGDDAEREPFHLDDTELAKRLVRDRGLIRYSTPPHTHLLFQDMVLP